MIEVREVRTYRERRRFLLLPKKLYKGCPNFCPPLYGDEVKALKRKSPYESQIESLFLLAYQDKKPVGRIQAFVQHEYNRLHNQKDLRFTRFDCINDQEVANALFDKAKEYAISKGLDTIKGPLGPSDFEREGLLVEGFDEPSTFETQYSYPYYQTLIENYGFQKDVDWVESKILKGPSDLENGQKLEKIAELLLRKYDLHLADTSLKTGEYLNRYYKAFFTCIDKAYAELYGTVPFPEESQKPLMDQFKSLLNPKELIIILDKNEEAVGVALCFPSIAEAVKPSYGKLTPLTLLRILKAVKNPKTVDFGLMAIVPEYRNSGISAVFLSSMMKLLNEYGVERLETNPNLEDNENVRNQWKRFNATQCRRRRAYRLKLESE